MLVIGESEPSLPPKAGEGLSLSVSTLSIPQEYSKYRKQAPTFAVGGIRMC